MNKAQIKRTIRRTFEANGLDGAIADAVELRFGVRMPYATARAGQDYIEFSGGFERLSEDHQRRVVIHEACHVLLNERGEHGRDNVRHSGAWAEAMERAGVKDGFASAADVAEVNKSWADHRKASYQRRLAEAKAYRKTPEHRERLARKRARAAEFKAEQAERERLKALGWFGRLRERLFGGG